MIQWRNKRFLVARIKNFSTQWQKDFLTRRCEWWVRPVGVLISAWGFHSPVVLDACCTNTGLDWTGLDAGVMIGTGLNMVKTGPGLLVFDLLKIMTHSSKQEATVLEEDLGM